ncbi:MAG: hypothetical protein ACR2NW_09255 [Thermodesulfobacteriota bacterium]
MIKPQDLRVNNYVQAKSPEMHEYQSPVKIDKYYLELFLNGGLDVKPIPITEEILNRDKFKNVWPGFTLQTDDIEICLVCPHDDWYLFIGDWRRKLKGFHHLQNIVYDLTGIELTLKHDA